MKSKAFRKKYKVSSNYKKNINQVSATYFTKQGLKLKLYKYKIIFLYNLYIFVRIHVFYPNKNMVIYLYNLNIFVKIHFWDQFLNCHI